jgi:hypothetical protein
MKVACYNAEFEVPDFVVNKFIRDFEGLSNSSNRDSVLQLRDTIENIEDMIAQDPDILNEVEYLSDFIRAIAMKHALKHHGLLYDA